MATIELVCLNKKCKRHFTATNVKPGDFRTCFQCGSRRKIVKLRPTCERCKEQYSIITQDGIQLSRCPYCGYTNTVYNPIVYTSKRDQPHGRSKKPKRR
ncbi:MAG: hypothetical protein IKE91_02065 [Clostridia bacterium]|nr:hypothetical protein [Clostridia bacterium]